MAFSIASLWQAPEVNPINRKAHTIPFFNPINQYGRVFFFSWFGFFLAFWSWYAFPPLINDTIKKDLKLTKNEISNSNIIALTATLLVRLVAGPACDRWGPRKTFAATLLIGAIPTFLSGTAYTVSELYALRFFIGILGGSFVPCQVWSTGFFDKNIVGTSNSITAGLGNAGGGITYFLMPAIYNSLVSDHLKPHVAWRVAFVIPGILITVTAIALLLTCPDTPTGKWSDRHLAVQQNLAAHGVNATVVDVPGGLVDKKASQDSTSTSPAQTDEKTMQFDASGEQKTSKFADHEAQLPAQDMLDTARGEVIAKPSFKEAMPVIFSLQTLVTAACYFCTFGTELSVNSILGAYYQANFKKLGQTGSGNWAAMFGLLNVVCRPAGGILSDVLYRRTHTVWTKKIWLHMLSVLTGVFMLAIGLTNSHSKSTMFGLVAGLALFLEGANGANFSLVPHVHPFANGLVSGVTGAAGNFGGIIFAIIFRYNGSDYAKTFWIIGIIVIVINVAVSWIKPIPKGQVGGH